ncbi:MAG: M1 family metallopeptidase, partial [bacterium]|nr:M1 family metallopeptidase [bacterium]
MRAIVIILFLAAALSSTAYHWEKPDEMSEYMLRLEGVYGQKDYPPGVPDDPPVDHTYDVLHYDLYLDIDTANDDFDSAITIVKLEFTQNGVNSVGLQLTDNLNVSNLCKYAGPNLAYTHNNDILDITLDTTYNTGDQIQIQVTYSGSPTEGVYFESNGVVHSVSWPIYAHYWFPCYDAPWDKADEGCRIELDGLPSGWDAAMVGDEISTYVYAFDDPISTYNIAWNAKDNYSVYTQTNGLPSGCPQAKYSLYPEHYGNASNAFQNMPGILTYYADSFGNWPF